MKLPKSKAKIELPKAKVPKALDGVYRELRGQHLLPIVALLIASLIAIPLLLNESSDAPPAAAAAATASGAPSGATLTATRFSPGLRDYKDRLAAHKPVDPFANGLAPSGQADSESGEESSGGEAPPAPEIPQPSGGAGESVESPTGSGGESTSAANGPKGSGSPTIDSESPINVEVTAIRTDGDAQSGSVRYHQPQLTKLPSDSVPALTYVGPSDDGTKAMMLVSPQVSALAGDSKCVVPAAPCQLLALELAAPEALVYGPENLTYRIQLVKIGELSRSQPPRPRKGDGGDRTAIGPAMAARVPRRR